MKSRCTVAVLDAGVLPGYRHPDMLPGWTLNPGARPADSLLEHGTAVCSSILSVAPGATVLPVGITNKFGQLNTSLLEKALEQLLQNYVQKGLRVICMAFADYSNQQSDQAFSNSLVKKHIAALSAAGVLTVAAAGNWRRDFAQQPPGMAWPAILQEVISVGALEPDMPGQPAWYSQRLHSSAGTGCATTVFTQPLPPGDTSGATAKIAGTLAGLYLEDPGQSTAAWLNRFQGLIRPVADEQGCSWPVWGQL